MEGESEKYITCLCGVVETCEYGTLKEEMLRDRLVVGIRDLAMSQKLQKAISQKLQKEARLTLEWAKEAKKRLCTNNSNSYDETAVQKTP